MTSEKMLKMRTSPHIVSSFTTRRLMGDVVIALSLPLIAGIIFFGFYTLLTVMVTVLSCVLTEHIYYRLRKKPATISDLSAVVTGMILGLNLPPNVPLYICVIGAVFAIFFVKLLFGGLGKNFANPAAAARVFLLLAYMPMTQFIGAATGGDFTSVSTYLGAGVNATSLKQTYFGLSGYSAVNLQLFIGATGGSIGETSKLAILLGFAYLGFRKVINYIIPLSVIVSAAFFALIFSGDAAQVLPQLLTGGLLFGAVFMATDYSTSPMTRAGRIIFGIGIGLITMLIRFYGSYPEGVSFAILFMNLFVPVLDMNIVPVRFGEPRKRVVLACCSLILALMAAFTAIYSGVHIANFKKYQGVEYQESTVISSQKLFGEYTFTVKGYVNLEDKSESGWMSGSVTVKIVIKDDYIESVEYVTDHMKPGEKNPKGLDAKFFAQYKGNILKGYEFNSESTSVEKKAAVDNAVLGAITYYKTLTGKGGV